MQYYNPYLQQMQPVQMPTQSFVTVRSEDEAKNYPVAQGNSILFRDETSPYIYTKTMGFSQLDRPTFEKYRLIKEGEIKENPAPSNELKGEIESLRKELDELKKRVYRPKKQIIQEVDDDE